MRRGELMREVKSVSEKQPVGAGTICKAYAIILCRHLYVSSESFGTFC